MLTGNLSQDELITYITRVVDDVEDVIKMEFFGYTGGCIFTVSMLDTGHAFVWFSRSEVFFKIVGLTYDGSDIICNNLLPSPDSGEEYEENLRNMFEHDWSEPMTTIKNYTPPKNPFGFTPIFSRAFP